ncbi:hypothetical protein SDC9_158185 [bioreactor metagenome]|uniref:Uncharacterized protein n=1 Tax=bioreactor metagenome TaxID=1076179 RepID=A0A645F945_9ZZZZ
MRIKDIVCLLRNGFCLGEADLKKRILYLLVLLHVWKMGKYVRLKVLKMKKDLVLQNFMCLEVKKIYPILILFTIYRVGMMLEVMPRLI